MGNRTGRGPGPGVVEVRLSGEPDDISRAAVVLARAAEVLGVRGPWPNRRDPGFRVYLTVRVAGSGRAAARPRPPGPDPATAEALAALAGRTP